MATRSPLPPASASTVMAIPTTWLIALAALIVVPWVVVAGLYYGGDVTPESTPRIEGTGTTSKAANGAWGSLTLTPIVIAPPLEYVSADWGRNAAAEWVFPDATTDVVAAFLGSTGIAPEQLAQVMPRARQEPRIRGVVINPPADVVRALSPDTRARLYALLAKSTLNFDQAQSFRFFGTTTRDWFDGTLMSAATRQLVEPLVYKNGDFLHFADIESVRSQIPSPEERQYLAKALLRNATVMIRLSVDSPEEVSGLANYWGTGGRRTDIRPLLESISAANDNRWIDVVHLLPAFARNHLYRYPKIQTLDLTRPLLANCLWSSLNFFKERPDEQYLDVDYSLNALRTEYYVVEHGYQLGDVVALVDDEGDLFHVAVHLADGLVFTKNGTSPVAPWTIMHIDQLKSYYRVLAENPRVIYHRLNSF